MKVSVIISAYNGEKYLNECLNSILSQTLSDFEVILIDDMSTDKTIDIAHEYERHDKRFHVYQNAMHNHSNALNIGLKYACGKYIARIDQDDVMTKERLKVQSEYMDKHKFISVCGSWVKYFGDKNGDWHQMSGEIIHPLFSLLLGTIMFNPSTMIRKEFLDKKKIEYNKKFFFAEDFKLWSDIAKAEGKFCIIPYYLTMYRISSQQASSKHYEEQYQEALDIKNDLLNYLIENRYFPENNKIKNVFEILDEYNNKNLIRPETIFQLAHEILINKETYL